MKLDSVAERERNFQQQHGTKEIKIEVQNSPRVRVQENPKSLRDPSHLQHGSMSELVMD